MKKITLITACLFLCLSAGTVLAQEEEGEEGSTVTTEDSSCQNSCPDGQAKVAFADGTKVACACTEESTGMVETVETEGES